MVTSKSLPQRWLHTLVSLMCGRGNSCGTKIDYRSQPGAERAAGEMAAKHGREFDAYQCWFCWGWHIGNVQGLTPRKFLRIFWFWVIKRRRKGPKCR